jgi:helix-turn-helix protein
MALDEYLTEKEFAALMRVPLLTAQEWRRRGMVPPHVRVAFKTILYRKADIAAWLDAKRVEPQRIQEATAA